MGRLFSVWMLIYSLSCDEEFILYPTLGIFSEAPDS
jgi:hypothetical protein